MPPSCAQSVDTNGKYPTAPRREIKRSHPPERAGDADSIWSVLSGDADQRSIEVKDTFFSPGTQALNMAPCELPPASRSPRERSAAMQPAGESQSVRVLAADGSCSATLNYTHPDGRRLMPQKVVIRDARRTQQEGGISLEVPKTASNCTSS